MYSEYDHDQLHMIFELTLKSGMKIDKANTLNIIMEWRQIWLLLFYIEHQQIS